MISVLVPYRERDEWTARAWEYVQAHYEREHPDFEVIVGTCDGPWSKGRAVHDAYLRASGDLLVIADADSFVDQFGLTRAVEVIDDDHQWAVPHGTVVRLGRATTEQVYAGMPPRARGMARPRYRGICGGGIVVLTRTAYEEVGGIDPRFCGWGGEDLTFGWKLDLLCPPQVRFGSLLWHLWHPPEAPDLRGSPESEALVGRYRDARRDPEAMRALIGECDAPDPAAPPDRHLARSR